MKKHLLLYSMAMLMFISARAQQACTVTDKQPVLLNGLEIGYRIKSLEVKAVSDKGDFSRYSISFYVTNTSSESKIMMYQQGFNLFNNESNQLAQFVCLNATGARLTSKTATIEAQPCTVIAKVDDKDANGKTVQNKRVVQIGYWVKAGQTISVDEIMIVPLNEQLNMQVKYLANMLGPVASADMNSGGGYQPAPGQYPQPTQPPMGDAYSSGNGGGYVERASQPFNNPDNLFKIKNAFNGTYVNTEDIALKSTAIQPGWFSAQWMFIQVPGTKFYNIKNRFRNGYIATDRGYVVFKAEYPTSPGFNWILEPAVDGTRFRIRNANSGTYLGMNSDQLILTGFGNDGASGWVIERAN